MRAMSCPQVMFLLFTTPTTSLSTLEAGAGFGGVLAPEGVFLAEEDWAELAGGLAVFCCAGAEERTAVASTAVSSTDRGERIIQRTPFGKSDSIVSSEW